MYFEGKQRKVLCCLFILDFLFCFVFHGNSMQVWNKIIMISADRILIYGWTIFLKCAENAALLLVSYASSRSERCVELCEWCYPTSPNYLQSLLWIQNPCMPEESVEPGTKVACFILDPAASVEKSTIKRCPTSARWQRKSQEGGWRQDFKGKALVP